MSGEWLEMRLKEKEELVMWSPVAMGRSWDLRYGGKLFKVRSTGTYPGFGKMILHAMKEVTSCLPIRRELSSGGPCRGIRCGNKERWAH